MNTKYIDSLYKRKTNFPAPEEARDKAKACDLLSKDIYNDSTRFVYELLQNADDASCNTGELYFQIDFIGDYMIVSHKGKAFTENDVESICSIGDGMKFNDAGQTGFKGIGFKSVFAHADVVIIKSGDFLFKFDRDACQVWDPSWGDQSQWENSRRLKGKDTHFLLPWQVIPMNAEIPAEIADLPVLGDTTFNVSTILKCKKISSLISAIDDLFSEAQLILFLRNSNVKIVVNGPQQLCIEKRTNNQITTIKRNGQVINTWLVKVSEPIDIPNDIKLAMEEDKDHYPEKLREADKTTMAFAVKLENGKLQKIDSGYNNVFAFLPTSVSKYSFPYIINANFITDASRQNLHQDYVWNQWLFKEMPKRFIAWMAEVASNKQYNLDYIKLIVKEIANKDELSNSYNQGMIEALSSIPILPIGDNRLIHISDAIWDNTDISSFIPKDILVSYINGNDKKYKSENILPRTYSYVKQYLKSLGVCFFSEELLIDFMKSEVFTSNHQISDNASLIKFLRKSYLLNQKDGIDYSWLKQLTFIYNNHEQLCTPTSVCFPDALFSSDISEDIDYINESVYNALSPKDIEWLQNIGVSDPSDVSIIETKKVISDGYITKDNAIDVLRYIFKLHTKGELTSEHYEILHRIPILTQKGDLKQASNCYMADIYKSTLPIEQFVNIDFVSRKYLNYDSEATEWNIFLNKIGVTQTLGKKWKCVDVPETDSTNFYFSDFIKEVEQCAETYSWKSGEGFTDIDNGNYQFYARSIAFDCLPYLPKAHDYDFSRRLWSYVVSNIKVKDFIECSLTVYGATLFYPRSIDKTLIKSKGIEPSYIKWVLLKKEVIPATDKSCHLASDVFTNAIPNAKEIAREYLPVIDIDSLLEESWADALGLKKAFKVNDLLSILTKISNNTVIEQSDKKQITLIYDTISSMFNSITESEKSEIANWGKNNRILAKDGTFDYPSNLLIITIDGFTGNHFAYTGPGAPSDSQMSLMRTLGVQIINKVEYSVSGSRNSLNTIKDKLFVVAPFIALLWDKDWEDSIQKIDAIINELNFVSVGRIELSYGDNNDKISKKVYYDAESKTFFVAGEWNCVRVLDGIENQLGKLLLMKSYAHMLKVLLTSEIDECVEYLSEYNVKIPDNLKNIAEERAESKSGKFAISRGTEGGDVSISISDTQYAGLSKEAMSDALTEAKRAVRQELENQGYSFENATGLDSKTYGNIYGVLDPEKHPCPLVVHSYRDLNRDFQLTAFDWEQLAQPNSMLYVYTRQGALCVPFYKLMADRGKINISFSTKNTECKDRMVVLASILSYFKGLHFDFGSLLPACTSMAERFNQPEKEMFETLSEDDPNLML